MRFVRWLVLGTVALALHLAALVTWPDWTQDTGARAQGRDGLVVSLAPAGSQAGTAQRSRQPEATAPEPKSQPEPERQPEPAENETEPSQSDTVKQETESKTRQDLEPEAQDEPDPRVTEAEAQAPSEPQAQQASSSEADTHTDTASSSEQTTEARESAKPEQERTARESEQAADKAATAGNAGQAGSGGGDAAGNSVGSAGGGDPGARADYLDKLRAHLARHKEYPRRARARRIEGTVRVAFKVHPDGQLSAVSIEEGSGSRLLDEAAQRMLERADPAPPFDDAMAQEPIELTLPVSFGLR